MRQIVWDTVNDCAMKAVAGSFLRTVGNSARYTLNGGASGADAELDHH
jgi:hypothetical protein